MRNLIFVLTLFLITVACKQQRSYQEDAIRYLEVNGTELQYNVAIDQMFELLQNQYRTQNVPESVWKELKNEKSKALSDIKEMLIPAYQSNFTQEDIRQLILFYESDTGKLVAKGQSTLTDVQREEFNNFVNSEIGKKVQNQSESLKTMVGEVSESWRKALYDKVNTQLKTKGFKLQ